MKATTYWVALLRYIGCTGHAHEVSAMFGDEIDLRARTLLHDAGNPSEVIRDLIAAASADTTGLARLRSVAAVLAGGKAFAVLNFSSGCEVADALLARLGFGDDVRDALRHTFERWNGKGWPSGSRGEAIPLPMRIVHLTHDMEAIARHHHPDEAVALARRRRGRTYDPGLTDAFVAGADGYFERLAKAEPWDDTLDLEPSPRRLLRGAELDAALTVAADFVDLKSAYTAGHSRRCADLAAAAARQLGLGAEAADAVRRAALVHDLGTTAIPNSIWDKPGPLTRSEFDRVEMHTLLTEQMLRRSPAFASLAPLAAAHHERSDGSGYHKGLRAAGAEVGAAVLAAADAYAAMTADRVHRPALAPTTAAAELRRMAAEGRLPVDVVEAVLSAAGHTPAARRRAHPAGLTDREVDVLRLAAQGMTTRQIGERLFISAKTADHHIQHVYAKIGVRTRGAASLWAMQNNLAS